MSKLFPCQLDTDSVPIHDSRDRLDAADNASVLTELANCHSTWLFAVSCTLGTFAGSGKGC